MPHLIPSVVTEAGAQAIGTDPFLLLEFYAFRIALLILFIVGLFRLVKREIGR